MKIGLSFLVAWSIGSLIGCGSTPVRYYTLAASPDEISAVTTTSVTVNVRVIHMPPQLNRAGILLRADSSEIVLLDDERWASPVRDEIQQALHLDLQRRLKVSEIPSAASRKLTLDLDVQRFEAELGRYALLEANWSLHSAESGTGAGESLTVDCRFRADEKIGPGYAAMVKGYQEDIARLADAVAAEWIHRGNGIEASCGRTHGG
jgi:hypothetical protein